MLTPNLLPAGYGYADLNPELAGQYRRCLRMASQQEHRQSFCKVNFV
jgi:hypothetical protein